MHQGHGTVLRTLEREASQENKFSGAGTCSGSGAHTHLSKRPRISC